MFYTIYKRPPNPVTECEGPSATRQEFKRECDINCILHDYQITGKLPDRPEPNYGDFTSVQDFATSLERVNAAKDTFLNLPAEVRARFGNDPMSYYSFVLDPSNVEECVKLGLATPHHKEESTLDVLKGIRDNVTPKGTAEPSSAG